MSKFSDINNLGQTTLLASIILHLDNSKKRQLNFLREEAQLRMRALLNNKKTKIWPRQILALGESVKGDLRTPEGVYFVTSWISPNKLPAKYGVGAFLVNYPNELDKHNGKTGYGIWLHGTDKGSYNRPPRDSEGCVVLTNIDLSALKSEIEPGVTPVVITNKVEWIDYASWQQERQDILQAVESWRVDWESMNINKYLSHYGKDFWSTTHNLKSWSARKRLLAKNKTYQSVNFSNLSVLLYPQNKKDTRQIAVVRLQQDYK